MGTGNQAEDGKTTRQGKREPPGTGKQQTEDNGRHWWRATSYSGWTKPRWKVKQESNRQRTMEDIDGGLHPIVDGQSLGERWNRKATDRGQWKTLMEGYILQWMDKAQVKGVKWELGEEVMSLPWFQWGQGRCSWTSCRTWPTPRPETCRWSMIQCTVTALCSVWQ